MKVVDVQAAKTQLSKLLAYVEATQMPVVICRNGKPIADLVPHRKRSRLVPRPALSKIEINYDPTEDLAEDEWPKRFQ